MGRGRNKSRRVHDATECFVVLSDSADIVITGGTDGSVAAWNFKSGERIWVHESHNGEVTSLDVSGEYVVIRYEDDTVRCATGRSEEEAWMHRRTTAT